MGTIVNTFGLFFPLKEEKEASDYMVSADRNYVAFLSNYSKVAPFPSGWNASAAVS